MPCNKSLGMSFSDTLSLTLFATRLCGASIPVEPKRIHPGLAVPKWHVKSIALSFPELAPSLPLVHSVVYHDLVSVGSMFGEAFRATLPCNGLFCFSDVPV